MKVWVLLANKGMSEILDEGYQEELGSSEVVAVFTHKPNQKEKKQACADYLFSFLGVDSKEEFEEETGETLKSKIEEMGHLSVQEAECFSKEAK